MSQPTLSLTPALARRLFIHKQRLAGPAPAADASGLMDVTRGLGCLQLDPISVVARSHLLVLFSRVGAYDPAHLDQLLWRERTLFEYWAHCASIVLTEDYPLHSPMMRDYPWSERTRTWVRQNDKLKRHILAKLRKRGPLLSRDFSEDGLDPEAWVSTGWTSGRNVSRMLDFLWIGGRIMVAGRQGIQKVWDLSERVLPEWTPREKLAEREVTRRAAQRALRALGAATPRQINFHFLRGRYPNLKKVLVELEKEKRIRGVEIKGWPGQWYLHADDEPVLDELRAAQHREASPWDGTRTTLLSPFDNLICDRARTEQMFNFDFRIEIYTPKSKRKYGYYVLPILHGDRLIGRVDPEMDRERGELRLNAVYAEDGAPKDAGRAVASAIEDLAAFLGARKIGYNSKRIPAFWKRALL
jgi:hypothetical protein